MMNLKSTVLLSLLIGVSSWSSAANLNLVGATPSPGQEKAYNALNKALAKKNLNLVQHTTRFDVTFNATQIKALSQPFTPEIGLVTLGGKELQYWYDLGTLSAISSASPNGSWAELMPDFVLKSVTHRNQVIGIPISIHTTNWLWANKLLIDNTAIEFDGSWSTFVAQLSALQKQGVTPMIMDGSHEQDLLLFETLYLSMFGAKDYQEVFSNLSSTALRSADTQFHKAFNRLAEIRPYITRSAEPAPWFSTIDQLAASEAGYVVQSMRAIGEFNAYGKIANQQYYCYEFPGEFKPTAYRVDSIAALKQDSNADDSSISLASQVLLSKDAQFIFNNYVGGHPVIPDTGLEAVNECMASSLARIEAAKVSDSLEPSMAMGMSLSITITSEIAAVIEEFFTTNLSPADAAKRLQKRLRYASLLIS